MTNIAAASATCAASAATADVAWPSGALRCTAPGASLTIKPTRKKKTQRKCSAPDCTNNAKSKGLCKRHGGGMRCRVDGCTTSARPGGLCIAHGGGLCKVENCVTGARSGGMCLMHQRITTLREKRRREDGSSAQPPLKIKAEKQPLKILHRPTTRKKRAATAPEIRTPPNPSMTRHNNATPLSSSWSKDLTTPTRSDASLSHALDMSSLALDPIQFRPSDSSMLQIPRGSIELEYLDHIWDPPQSFATVPMSRKPQFALADATNLPAYDPSLTFPPLSDICLPGSYADKPRRPRSSTESAHQFSADMFHFSNTIPPVANGPQTTESIDQSPSKQDNETTLK